jgi:hypothetical protein
MLESRIETKLREEVERIGGKAFKFESQGNKGVPDRIVCLPQSRVIFIETKRPKGGRLSKIQKFRIKELQSMGMEVRVIFTMEQIKEFIREVESQ